MIYLRIYVAPFAGISISKKLLKSEKTPAVDAYEICDYLLELMDYLVGVLYHSHRQVCKICIEKYYSLDPRLVLNYVSWEDYGKLCSKNPHEPFAEAFREGGSRRRMEPEQIWDGAAQGMVDDEPPDGCIGAFTFKPPINDSPLSHPTSTQSHKGPEASREPKASRPKTRHRQPTKVSERLPIDDPL